MVVSQHSTNEPYFEQLEHLFDLSDDEVLHVLSISYADEESSVPQTYTTKWDERQHAGDRGDHCARQSGEAGGREEQPRLAEPPVQAKRTRKRARGTVGGHEPGLHPREYHCSYV
ncbi:putative Peptidase S53 domain-containing protein [Seiridium cardinale]|uniref:Peptidase S53 domain-containing protein n=1 Tax=Seiridium cardinale TaxID=138064 RepID=A0ABR2Y2K3_9PEZI